MENNLTIHDAVQAYLESVALSRRANTARAYQNSLKSFTRALLDANSDPRKTSIDELTEDAVTWFAAYLKDLSPTTISLR
jgi:site-specific recombinase XerD